ncbi:UDP-glucuronosyltransferase 2C1-like isoform X1 [Conger conger]|uniref:UDP-glucuronosyltransferase 2C1-like isoform X1 n=1 Tax=Conger conger TaxID=82655 RepID=UPI002A5A2188|nr:UDP-glucuronosyltransferase 2C1-like isoform X1 [Conger conger]
MFRSSQCVPVLVLVLCHTQHTYSGKVLLWPGEHSHWLNMKNIVAALSAKGHEMTVLTHSATPTITADQSTSCSFEIVPVPYTAQDMTDMMDEIFHYWMYELPNESFIQVSLKIKEIIQRTTEMNKVFCRAVFKNKELLEKLRQARYDVLLTDPMFLCGELLAETLDLPLIISLRFSHANTLERLCGQLPAPPSYVPSTGMQYTDEMDFSQRLKNYLFYFSQDILFHTFGAMVWDSFFTEMRGKPTSVCEAMGKADIWLIRTYWDFEYPRPFLPNFKFVGGLHCKPAKPLPEDMEEFVQSSGEDGIVVFSLGSMIKNLTRERRDVIASALGQISQKVLWRYSGEKPDTLPPNIRLLDWIPQNDLLGHPKTKAFITHGGTNGMYEAIYHGVPMVGIPLFGDQPDNMHHMKTKGAAVILDLNQFQGQDLVLAVNAVINDPSYKESTMRLSRIHHDQPMSALDQAVFWIEFVMRNKGAKHLRVQAHNLSWYQYHCLDVLAALLATVVLIAVIFFKACCFCLRKCCTRSKTKSKKE